MGNRDAVRLGLKDQLLLVESVSSLLQSGLPLSESFAASGRTSLRTRPGQAAQGIGQRLCDGATLTSAVSEVVSLPHPFVRAMVRVIDETGDASTLLGRACTFLRTETEFRESARTASVYPVFVLGLTLAGVSLMRFVVLPRVGLFLAETGVVAAEEIARISAAAAHILGSVLGAFTLAVLLAFLYRVASRRPSGNRCVTFLARSCLSAPFLGRLEQSRNLGVMMEAVTAMLECGVTVDHAIDVSAGCLSNPWIATRLRQAVQEIRTGSCPGRALYPLFEWHHASAVRLLQIEAGADLAGAINGIANGLRQLRTRLLSRLGTALEPGLVLVAGGILLLTINVTVRPLFGLYELVMP